MNLFVSFSLAPKTYFAFDPCSGDTKRSSKGIQKQQKLSYEEYKTDLTTLAKPPIFSEVIGFFF